MIRPTFSQLLARLGAGAVAWRKIFELLESGLVKRPRCPCGHLGNLLQEQEKWRAWEESDRWSQPYLREIVVQFAAERLGWGTLRGGGKRRRRLETLLPELHAKKGRPTKLFLTTADLEWSRRFVSHLRSEGRAHVEDELSKQLRFRLNVRDPDRFGVHMQLMLEDRDVRSALEIAEEAAGLSEGMWSWRKEGIARRFLAALVGCSESVLKKRLTDEIEVPPKPMALLEPMVMHLSQLHWRDEWKDRVTAAEDPPVIIPDEAEPEIIAQIALGCGLTDEELRRRVEAAGRI